MPFQRGLEPASSHLGRARARHRARPSPGLEDLAAVVFEATERLVPVTHPQPFQADVVLARGRVPRELASFPLEG